MPVNWKKPALRDGFLRGALVLFGWALLRQTQVVAAAVSQGLTLCIQVLLPSLFPFFVLSSLLTMSGITQRLAPWFQRPMSRLFHLPGSCAPALLLGAVGGYPVGARTVSALYQQRLCSREEAARALRFCNNAGPAFFIGSIGGGLLSDTRLGLRLYLVHLAAALCMGLFGKTGEDTVTIKQFSFTPPRKTTFLSDFLQAVSQSFSAFGGVCAFVLFFAVIMGILRENPLFSGLCALLPGNGVFWQGLLSGMLEITSGASLLAAAPVSPRLCLTALSFLCGWGGLSVQCQSVSAIQQSGLPCGAYLGAKLIHGFLAAGVTFFIC